MSALGHKRTFRAAAKTSLFDHLVGAAEQRRRHGKTERLCGRQIKDEIELGWLLDRQILGLRPAQNLIDIVTGAPKQLGKAWPISHETSRFDGLPGGEHRWQACG